MKLSCTAGAFLRSSFETVKIKLVQNGKVCFKKFGVNIFTATI